MVFLVLPLVISLSIVLSLFLFHYLLYYSPFTFPVRLSFYLFPSPCLLVPLTLPLLPPQRWSILLPSLLSSILVLDTISVPQLMPWLISLPDNSCEKLDTRLPSFLYLPHSPYQPGLHGITDSNFNGQKCAQYDVGDEHQKYLIHGRLRKYAEQNCGRERQREWELSI